MAGWSWEGRVDCSSTCQGFLFPWETRLSGLRYREMGREKGEVLSVGGESVLSVLLGICAHVCTYVHASVPACSEPPGRHLSPASSSQLMASSSSS